MTFVLNLQGYIHHVHRKADAIGSLHIEEDFLAVYAQPSFKDYASIKAIDDYVCVDIKGNNPCDAAMSAILGMRVIA